MPEPAVPALQPAQHYESLTQAELIAALRARDAHDRLIAELTAEFALALRRDPEGSMLLEWVTAAFPTVTGYTLEELWAAKGMLPPTHPDDVSIVRKYNECLMTLGAAEDEWRILNKAGEIRWVRVRGRGLRDLDDGPFTCFVSAVQDITDRRRAAHDLGHQADLLDRISEAIISTDREGRIITWNRAAEEVYGWRADEAIGRKADDLLCLELAVEIPQVMGDLRARGSWRGEVRERRRDGTPLMIATNITALTNEVGRRIGTIVINRDITEHKAAERRLSESEQRLQLALESANAGAWDWNPVTNTAIWSSGNYRILGYEPGAVEAGYANWLAAVHPDDRAAAEAAVGEAAAAQGSLDIEFRIVWPDGQVRWVRDVGRFLYSDIGQASRMIGLQFDITAHKLTEQQAQAGLRRTRTLARIAARLGRTLDLDQVLATICLETAQALQLPLVALSLHGENFEQYPPDAFWGEPAALLAALRPRPPGEYRAIFERPSQVHVFPDVQTLAGDSNADVFSAFDVRTLIATSLWHDARPLGVLRAFSFSLPRELTDDERLLLKAVADLASRAIANARLYQATVVQSRQLEALSARLAQVQEAERQRLAQELHDQIGPPWLSWG